MVASKLFSAFLALTFVATAKTETCAYENCPSATYKPDMLNVHLVCHTHDDSGWLKTVDQYYWGSEQSITTDGVQYILNTLFPALGRDPNKKFSYCESNFFWRWWKQQTEETKRQVKEIVDRGQLEFIGGGWVQHDEAATHYGAMIDQMTTGHSFFNETFGRCGIPKIGWQIDPFGHSRESAALMAQMGFDALFFARIHYVDRNVRWADKSMEMIWHGSDEITDPQDILTGVFWQHYGPPNGFCFDSTCGDEPFMDDPTLEGYNVDEKVAQFVREVKDQAQYYATNHIMLTMGSDFQYKNADEWFDNLDKLIKYVNAAQDKGTNVNVFYSTPSCYAQALASSGYDFPNKTDDFFPYASSDHSYWTGYFTSRPALKGFVRSTNNLLQICQALDAIAMLDEEDRKDVESLHRAFGIAQHHDAVSGTAKQAVTDDYQKMLYEGIINCQKVTNNAMARLSPKSSNAPEFNSYCTLMNISVCDVSQMSDTFVVTAHNVMARQLKTFVKIPVDSDDYLAINADGNEIQAQVYTTFITSQLSDQMPSTYQVIVPVEIAPLGYSTFYLKKNDDSKIKRSKRSNTETQKEDKQLAVCTDCKLSNNLVTVNFDPNTGLVESVSDLTSDTHSKLTQNIFWYRGADPSMAGNQASGAYIFRPAVSNVTEVSTTITMQKMGKEGDYVQEMRQIFSPWVSQTVRLYQGKPYVEFEWTVGPIPFQDGQSKEVILRYDSDINNNSTFYTDANGRQIMTRKLDYQSTYPYTNSEPVAGNYYPVNTRIYIKDNDKQITILTDRSQGGSSLNTGSVELMVHRRDLWDDGFGVNEALNETGVDGKGLVVTGKHWLLLSKPNTGARMHRIFAQEMFHQPLYTFASINDTFEEYENNFRTAFAGLTKGLPYNVNLLTLSQWKESAKLLIRFEHVFQPFEDEEFSRPVTIDLKNLFTTFDVQSMTEYSLTVLDTIDNTTTTDFTIILRPMQIRTFLVDIVKATASPSSLHQRQQIRPHRH